MLVALLVGIVVFAILLITYDGGRPEPEPAAANVFVALGLT